jgi:hypothetical protein
VDVSISGTIRSDRGSPAGELVGAAVAIVPSLGRVLSANQQFAVVNLVVPGEVWETACRRSTSASARF